MRSKNIALKPNGDLFPVTKYLFIYHTQLKQARVHFFTDSLQGQQAFRGSNPVHKERTDIDDQQGMVVYVQL